MAYSSDLARTKDWHTEILTDGDLEGQLDLIINWVMAAMNLTTGHDHSGTANKGPKISLTAGVSGILPVGNGGTGTSSLLNGIPVGTVLSWLKTLTGVPALPDGFVECNGQTLSDSESLLNGQVIPNLNSNHAVLIGNTTSGGTTTDPTFAHTHTTPDHTHNLVTNGDAPGRAFLETQNGGTVSTSAYTVNSGAGVTGSTGAASSYDVVWIIKVR